MQSPSPEQSVRSTGLPPGVEAGELGPRFLAAVIDWLAPALVVGILNGVAGSLDPGAGRIVLSLVGSLVGLAWFIVVWWMFATKAAGPGMRVMKLQLVGLSDGRPIGWLRYLGRAVILSLLAGTVIGLVILLVLLLKNQRHQGLHDLVVDSVVIKQRAVAPRPSPAASPPLTVGGQAHPAPDSATSAPATSDSATSDSATSDSATSDSATSQPALAVSAQGQPQYGPQSRQFPPAANALQPPADPLQPVVGASVPSLASADFPVGGEYGMHVPADGPESRELHPGESETAEPTVAEAESAAPESSTGYPVGDRLGQESSAAPNPVSTVFPAAAPPSVSDSVVATSSDAMPAEEPAVQAPVRPLDVADPDRPLDVADPARPLDAGWVAGLDDGRDLEVAGLVLLGRNPQGRPGEDDAELIKIADDTRTVSKTHLALGVDANGMYVMDRGSTNGSTVTSAGGVSTLCPPGAVIQVDEGNIVSFGDHWLEIKRAPAPEQ